MDRDRPILNRNGRFLMTPDQHRETAARLRERGEAKAIELATLHDALAGVIQRRIDRDCPPTAPA